MTLLLFLPEWLNGFNFLMGLFTLLVLIAGATIVILANRRTSLSGLQVERANAAEALVKTRDAEIVSLNNQIGALEDELENVTAEHRTLAGLSISKLIEHWVNYEAKEAEMADLRQQIRILKLRKDARDIEG